MLAGFAALGLVISACGQATSETVSPSDVARIGKAEAPDPQPASTQHEPTLRSRLSRLERRTAPGRPHRQILIGHSSLGRPIRLVGYGYGRDPTRILVFGCIHGTECAASGIRVTRGPAGCPPAAAIFVVPNLNPDGLAEATRLNGRGVDLNRNFPSGWEPMYSRGDPQYSGPRPFSEPETRLAATLIRTLKPDVTIWFHQEAEPLVRAWGPSVPAARRYAHLVELPFVKLRWLAGTAPNWQNHHFPGTSSFVVELPPGPLSADDESRLATAIGSLGAWKGPHRLSRP